VAVKQALNSGVVTLRKLSNEQVEAFDREYVDARRLDRVCAKIDDDFPDGDFTLLDVGGGNGRFADQLLARYPKSRATVWDNSELLLERNAKNDRKQLRLGSATCLESISESFDLISLHWLLHHLVGDSYGETRANQLSTLSSARQLLSDRGRISVYENDYLGWIPDPWPTWLIYRTTASRPLARISRALGANTAGVGVGFNSFDGWRRIIQNSGLEIVDHAEPDAWERKLPWHVRLVVGLKDIRVGHYWLRAK